MNPPTDCISPIGQDLLIESLAREYPEAFLRAVTRSPSVYRGNPFQVEVALAYGKGVKSSKKYRAHDESNSCKAGDMVRIVECAPKSKTKRWEVLEA